jgi:hypothetical protein
MPPFRLYRAHLKSKVIALAVVERSRKKQCARIANIKEGDANTKFFHLRVNARRRKTHIYRLKHNQGWVMEHGEKESIIHNHSQVGIGRGRPREQDFNWEEMNFSTPDFHNLGDPISQEEVKSAINDMFSSKAPSLDGLTSLFFKKCWEIIKVDIMRVVEQFGNLQTSNFQWLNSANVALLPKKDVAEDISEFRPISLIHMMAKIIAKVLDLRLGPHMNDLVSNAQSAFIKKHSIHDNFLYVKNLATRLHKNRKPALLFKLDIRKAFDSMRWEYLLDLLQRRGFPSRFCNWIVALLSTASSRILLNGIAGAPIFHGRGLRQGDPLSPMLFVLVIDPLHIFLRMQLGMGSFTRLEVGLP